MTRRELADRLQFDQIFLGCGEWESSAYSYVIGLLLNQGYNDEFLERILNAWLKSFGLDDCLGHLSALALKTLGLRRE